MGTDCAGITCATRTSGTCAAHDTTSVDVTTRSDLAVAADAGVVVSVADATGIARRGIAASGGHVVLVVDGQHLAFTVGCAEHGADRADDAGAGSTTASCGRVDFEARGASGHFAGCA